MTALRKALHLVLVCAFLLFGIGAARAQTVVLGTIGLSFHAVVGAVAHETLDRLGHPVDLRTAPHEEMFPLLARGEVDLLATAWLPYAHSHLFDQYQDRALRLATVYSDARLYWAVPAYVPVEAVRTIDDLKKPDVLARMDKTIRGIGPGAGLMVRSARLMPEYGLIDAGYTLVPGPAADWIANFRAANAETRWMVMPLWQPHFLNRAYQVRIIEEPRGILGGADEAVLVAARGFPGKVPARTVDTLRRIAVGLDGVTEMDYAVNVEGRTPREAARAWMERNAAAVRSWGPGL